MAKTSMLVLAFMFGILIKGVSSETIESGGDQFEALLARIESLEVSDAANKAKIAEMESTFKIELDLNKREISYLKIKMDEMKSSFRLKEASILGEINEMKTAVTDSKDDNAEQPLVGNEDVERPFPAPNKIQRQGKNLRKDRGVPKTEVAFYATHTKQLKYVGNNNNLPFTDAVTNIGNAFNTNTDTFTAPVDGTYVLHATIIGSDVSAPSHMRAHFGVNGRAYSVFYATPYDQSSQMLVIDLKAGHTVTVRNDYADTGYIGDYHSTFSGFLLYQHYPSGAVIGK